MSILFTDSADGYASIADLVARWTFSISGTTEYSNPQPSSNQGRFAAGAIRFVEGSYWSANTCALAQALPPGEGDTTYLSMAFHLPATGNNSDTLITFANGYYNPCRTDTSGSTFSSTDYPTYLSLVLNTAGTLSVRRANTIVATSAAPLPVGGWMWIEVAVKVDTQANGGKVHIKVNGEDFLIFNGNTYTAGPKSVNLIGLWTVRGVLTRYDDIIIHTSRGEAPTTFLGDVRLDTLRPNADGDSSGSTPSSGPRWDAVNDISLDGDATYVEASTVGATDLYQFSNFPIPPQSVIAVAVTTVAKATGTTNRKLKIKAKSGATVGESPAVTVTPGSYRPVTYTFATNPATGQPWTPAEVDAAQFGWSLDT